MATFLPSHFETEGPFGIPMKDRQAKALEALVRTLPREEAYSLRRTTHCRGVSELQQDGRTDVSWITEETPDRVGDVVLAEGMDDSHFQLNPLVTLNHRYDQPPVGRSLWRKRVREGNLMGVKAKTSYPTRPERWSAGDWPPDLAFEMVKAGLLHGKSIGFLPLKMRSPTAAEIDATPALAKVRHIIERWLLVEYACCYLPMQPHAVVQEVAKSVPTEWREWLQLPEEIFAERHRPLRFTTEAEIAQLASRLTASPNLEKALQKALIRTWRKAKGIV